MDTSIERVPPTAGTDLDWKALVAAHQTPSRWRANWQIVNSVGGYVLLWYLMYLSLPISWLVTMPLAILAGGLLVRVFIIFHDCGHGSFFRSRWANDFWGSLTGVLTFTSYHHWRWEHATHHATNADLDRRGIGDVWTLTVEEYLSSPRWKRVVYRVARNPFFLFIIGPLVHFVVRERFSSPHARPRERASVWMMNVAIVGLAAILIQIFGWMPWLIIQTTVLGVGGAAGVWLFYVQHQFEGVYWGRGENWDFKDAALKGSSFYRLPAVLQWFAGNIGYHHIHHLSSRIPNYNLAKCHRSVPIFEDVKPLTLWDSLKSLRLRLWDEQSMKLISFSDLRKRMKARKGIGSCP